MKAILDEFDAPKQNYSLESLKVGLINETWVVKNDANVPVFILQRINTSVFPNVESIQYNIRVISQCMGNAPLKSAEILPNVRYQRDSQSTLFIGDSGVYRMFDFVPNSYCIQQSVDANEVYDAGSLFGRFFRHCNEHPINNALRITIPGFHNLTLRYTQFNEALQRGVSKRITAQETVISELQTYHTIIVRHYERLIPQLPIRTMHHDAKISNALFSSIDR